MTIFLYIFAFIMLAAGAYHFYDPNFYNPIMPDWFPKPLANAAGGVAELLIGAALLLPATRTYAIWAALALMVVFLPLHIIDLLRERPVIGSKMIAVVRLLIQFALIAALWFAAKGSK